MVQQIAFFVVVTLIGVATLAFADQHETKKAPAHSQGRAVGGADRSDIGSISPDQATREQAVGEGQFLDEVEESLQLLLSVNPDKPAAVTGERSMPDPGHGGNPNLTSMPR